MKQEKKIIGPRPRWAVVLLAALLTAACGFHLRGSDKIEMPAALSVLQLKVEGSTMQYNRLLVAMRDALRSGTDIEIQEGGDAPWLVLFNEQSDSRVLSVTSFGKVDEYLLKYEVSFRITDNAGRPLSEPQTVKLQRDHQFDRLNVLAKEREEQEMRAEMQRDAVQHILRRLSRVQLEPSDANQR